MERRRYGYLAFALTLLLKAPALASSPIHMSGRVLTPNGDGINDEVAFDAVEGGTIQGEVFTPGGRRVAALPSANGRLVWNGREMDGRAVESGVYVVQIIRDGAPWHGAVAVAR